MTQTDLLPSHAAGSPVVDLDLVALLCTRLCHDLSGPVGAIAAGTELLSDGDDDFVKETAALLAHSSDSAVAKLRFLRAALGTGQGQSSSLSLYDTIASYIRAVHGDDVALEWGIQNNNVLDHSGAPRIVLNMVLLALEALGGRGTVRLSVGKTEENEATFQAIAQGKRSRLDDAVVAALHGHRDGLTARTVQAYYLACLSAPYGGITWTCEPGWIELSSRLPSLGK